MLNRFGHSKNSNLPSFPGHGSSAEELQEVMGTVEQVALPLPLECKAFFNYIVEFLVAAMHNKCRCMVFI